MFDILSFDKFVELIKMLKLLQYIFSGFPFAKKNFEFLLKRQNNFLLYYNDLNLRIFECKSS